VAAREAALAAHRRHNAASRARRKHNPSSKGKKAGCDARYKARAPREGPGRSHLGSKKIRRQRAREARGVGNRGAASAVGNLYRGLFRASGWFRGWFRGWFAPAEEAGTGRSHADARYSPDGDGGDTHPNAEEESLMGRASARNDDDDDDDDDDDRRETAMNDDDDRDTVPLGPMGGPAALRTSLVFAVRDALSAPTGEDSGEDSGEEGIHGIDDAGRVSAAPSERLPGVFPSLAEGSNEATTSPELNEDEGAGRWDVGLWDRGGGDNDGVVEGPIQRTGTAAPKDSTPSTPAACRASAGPVCQEAASPPTEGFQEDTFFKARPAAEEEDERTVIGDGIRARRVQPSDGTQAGAKGGKGGFFSDAPDPEEERIVSDGPAREKAGPSPETESGQEGDVEAFCGARSALPDSGSCDVDHELAAPAVAPVGATGRRTPWIPLTTPPGHMVNVSRTTTPRGKGRLEVEGWSTTAKATKAMGAAARTMAKGAAAMAPAAAAATATAAATMGQVKDKLVHAKQMRSEDKDYLEKNPHELLTLLPPSNVSRHAALQSGSAVRAALKIPRGERTPDLTKLCKERVKVLLDLKKVKDDAFNPKKEVRLEGVLYGTIPLSCHTLDAKEALKEGCTRIKMDVKLPNGDSTNVYVFSIADDLVTLALFRRIGKIVHESHAWGNVRNKSSRNDMGVMTGLGHRVNTQTGKIEMYVTCQDNEELRDLLKQVNKRLARLVDVRAPEFCQSIRRHSDDFDFDDNLLGGKNGLGLSVMCSENYGNSAHRDTGDFSDTLSTWILGEDDDPELDGHYFLFPNASIDGSDGVAIKLFDGAVVVFDGTKLRHCTSVPSTEDGGPLPNDRLEGDFRRGQAPSVPNRLVFGFGYVLCENYGSLERPRVVVPIRSKEERRKALEQEKANKNRLARKRVAPKSRPAPKRKKV
jgi:hypothetical protein